MGWLCLFKKIGPNQLGQEWQYGVIDPNQYGRSFLEYSKKPLYKVYGLSEERRKTTQKKMLTKKYCTVG